MQLSRSPSSQAPGQAAPRKVPTLSSRHGVPASELAGPRLPSPGMPAGPGRGRENGLGTIWAPTPSPGGAGKLRPPGLAQLPHSDPGPPRLCLPVPAGLRVRRERRAAAAEGGSRAGGGPEGGAERGAGRGAGGAPAAELRPRRAGPRSPAARLLTQVLGGPAPRVTPPRALVPGCTREAPAAAAFSSFPPAPRCPCARTPRPSRPPRSAASQPPGVARQPLPFPGGPRAPRLLDPSRHCPRVYTCYVRSPRCAAPGPRAPRVSTFWKPHAPCLVLFPGSPSAALPLGSSCQCGPGHARTFQHQSVGTTLAAPSAFPSRSANATARSPRGPAAPHTPPAPGTRTGSWGPGSSTCCPRRRPGATGRLAIGRSCAFAGGWVGALIPRGRVSRTGLLGPLASRPPFLFSFQALPPFPTIRKSRKA